MKRFICLVCMLAVVMLPFLSSAQDNAGTGIAIHFLDVGQADAAIVLCDGKVMMIDGGQPEDSSFIYSYLTNTLKVMNIDYVIASHPHEDHIGGISGALNACTVGTIYSPVVEYSSDAFEAMRKYAFRQGLELKIPYVGESFQLGSAVVRILSPAQYYSNENNLSIVIKIEYGDTSFLFMGDAEAAVEDDLIASCFDLQSTLLRVGHHGSDTSSTAMFLREVKPTYAVFSVGEGNPYGHPSNDVLGRFHEIGAQILRTDLHGNIVCFSDGKTISFKTEHHYAERNGS